MIPMTNTFTRFANYAAAASVASSNAADAEGMTFKVVETGEKFVVVAVDEDGFELGAI